MQRSTHPWLAAAAALSLGSAHVVAAQQPSFATIVPVPRADENSGAAHAELVRKAGSGVIDVYFVGDSITRRWGALDYPELLANFNGNFFGWNAANFGWGGDRTQNILWRLDHGELPPAGPKVFVVQAGTNNLADFESTEVRVAAITAGIEAIVERCRRHAPTSLIVLTAMFPRRDRPEFNSSIAAINENLAALGDDGRVRYLDIGDALVDSRGYLSEAMSDDGLHLSAAAYQVWAEALKPILVERLGAALDVDVAPAATGNPAAR
ncbi:MAG TPA: GDSL-type esterase/lipase family protein [Gammaproteobacteria bacterium]